MENERSSRQNTTLLHDEALFTSNSYCIISASCLYYHLHILTPYLYAHQTFESDGGIPLRFHPQQLVCPSQSLSGWREQNVSYLSRILHLQTQFLLNMTCKLEVICTSLICLTLIRKDDKYNVICDFACALSVHV